MASQDAHVELGTDKLAQGAKNTINKNSKTQDCKINKYIEQRPSDLDKNMSKMRTCVK